MNGAPSTVTRAAGRGIPVRGNDIDTDRIIPARYLRNITFEGLGEFAFEDDRKSTEHPFDDARYRGASILLVNANFGCGSSREHAPQSIMRWGIRAIVGESFGEIFQGNCTAMGLPSVTASTGSIQTLMDAIESDPAREITVDLEEKTLAHGDLTVDIRIPDGDRIQLLEGTWDATGMLLEGRESVRSVAWNLPYISGF